MNLQIIPIKTRVLQPPQDDLFTIIDSTCPKLQEKDIVSISSKALAIHQGRCIKNTGQSKKELIEQQADISFPRNAPIDEHLMLTIKQDTFSPSAGIDESNAGDYYVLWPDNPFAEAKKIHAHLKEKHQLNNLAIIITDSFLIPMRYGVIGISIGFHGLNPLKDYRGEKDIFGKDLVMTQVNLVDSLATMGTLAMGEGNEQQPIAIIRGCDFIEFTEQDLSQKFKIPLEQDLYYPLIKKLNS